MPENDDIAWDYMSTDLTTSDPEIIETSSMTIDESTTTSDEASTTMTTTIFETTTTTTATTSTEEDISGNITGCVLFNLQLSQS